MSKEPGPLERSFIRFNKDNPWVYMRLVQLCFKLKNSGFTKYSMRTLIAVLRFEWDLKTVTVGAGADRRRVKLNNNHSPYYARKLVKDFPEFAGFFDMRRCEADARPVSTR